MEKEHENHHQPIYNFYGCINNYNVYQSPVTYEGQVNNYNSREENKETDNTPSKEQIARAVEKVKPLFWGTSAIATIFCVCRDRYNAALNISEFERQMMTQGIECPEGTIRNAMKNNPYMRLPIDKWAANGAKERVMILAREFEEKLITQE